MILDSSHFIIAHLVGDYLLQNDWMAGGKKRSPLICTVHVLCYLIPFLFIGLQWWQIVLIGLQHWMQDRNDFALKWMKLAGQQKFSQPPLAPWSIIVVDNTFHLLWVMCVVCYAHL